MTTSERYALGVAAFGERRYKDAIDLFEDVLREAPENLGVREYLLRAHYHRASLPLAEQQARSILVSDPNNEYVLLLLARSLERQSKHDEAAALRRRLAALTGDDRMLARGSLAS